MSSEPTSAAASRSFLVAGCLFVGLLMLLLVAGRSAMLHDPGMFWHVAAGQRTLQTGQILREDPFSFTFFGRPWVDDQWLSECSMAWLHRHWGWDGLLLAAATILAIFYTWLATQLTRTGLKWLPAGLLVGVAMLVASPQFHLRPLILTLVLLGITMALLVDVESGRRSGWQLGGLVPLFALWANLHGGVLAGIVCTGWCLAVWCITGLPRDTASSNRPVARVSLAVLGTAMLLATLVNPYRIALPQEWFETLRMPLTGLIDEHRPLTFADPIAWGVCALGAVYAAVLLGIRPLRLRATWLLPLLWLVFAFLRARNASLFGVVTLVAMADMLPHSAVGRWLERREWTGPARTTTPWLWLLAPTVVLLMALGLASTGLSQRLHLPPLAKIDPAKWPIELQPTLNHITATSEKPVPIFNDLNFGGMVIYCQPRMRVFVDDRCSLYGSDFLLAYDRARRESPEQIEVWQKRYGFRHALVERNSAFDRYLSNSRDWHRLGQTTNASLYESLAKPRGGAAQE